MGMQIADGLKTYMRERGGDKNNLNNTIRRNVKMEQS
jgi:hypothetical protein